MGTKRGHTAFQSPEGLGPAAASLAVTVVWRRSSGHIPAAPPPLSSQFVPQELGTSLSPPVTSGHGGLGGEDASVGRGQVEGSHWGWSSCTAAAQAGAGLGQEEVNPSHSPVKFGQVTAFPKA